MRPNNFNSRLLVPISIAVITILLFASLYVTPVSYAVVSASSPATNLPSIKIISPHKSQQLPVDSPVLVSGVSSTPPADKTQTDCTVSVSLNAVKPYQNAVPTGHRGTSDYSTWRYGITANYATIKQGQNKITAKISCAASPTNLTKFNSLNVTGIGTLNTVNEHNGKNGANGANGISSGGNAGSAVGGNGGNGGRGGNANGGNGGSANGGNVGNGENGGSAFAGNGGNAIGGNGGNGGRGGNGGNAFSGIG